MIFRLTIVAAILCAPVHAQDAGKKARAAYQHFYCHHVIPYMSDQNNTQLLEQHENHVWSGIKEARQMLAEIENFKGANQQDWLENAPANWGYYLNAGPSEDFVIGMLYEQVRGVVERQILQKKDGSYIMDVALYQQNALTSYDENGCRDLK